MPFTLARVGDRERAITEWLRGFLKQEHLAGKRHFKKSDDQNLEVQNDSYLEGIFPNIKELSFLLQDTLLHFNLIIYLPKYSIYTEV